MSNYDKIDFQYQKYTTLNIDKFFIIGFVISILIMVEFSKMMGGLLLIVLIFGINIYKYTNKKSKLGSFCLGSDDFVIEIKSLKRKIKYYDVWLVIREIWVEEANTFGVGHTISNPNEYTILLKDNSKFTFRVSKDEEITFREKINKLNKKIYGMNSLGFGLTSKWKNMPKEELEKKEKDYEKEIPKTAYSLENAIKLLVARGNLLYEDRTGLDENQW